MKTVVGARRGNYTLSTSPSSSTSPVLDIQVVSSSGRNSGRHLLLRIISQRFFVKAVAGFLAFQLALLLWGFNTLSNQHNSNVAVPFFWRIQQTAHQRRQPDGDFNGYPVFFHDLTKNASYHSRPYTTIHCVGENYQGVDAAWMQRSCHFRFLCFNVSSKEFEVYSRPVDTPLQRFVDRQHPLLMDMTSSVIHDQSLSSNSPDNSNINSVSLGGIRPEWLQDHTYNNNNNNNSSNNNNQQHSLKWFPKVVTSPPPDQYYALEDGVVLAPFHSMGGWDPSRLLWDDFFPIYNLLHMFQLIDNVNSRFPYESHSFNKPLLMRMVLPSSPLKGSCDDDQDDRSWRQQCMDIINKYHHLLIAHDDDMTRITTTQLDATLRLKDDVDRRSNLVCAKDGVAGLAPLTISGNKNRGKTKAQTTSNTIGRAGLFWRFRTYSLYNLGLTDSVGMDATTMPKKISMTTTSRIKLGLYKHTLQRHFSTQKNVEISDVDTAKMSLREQVQIATQSTILFSTMREALIFITYLPRRSHIVIVDIEEIGNSTYNLENEEALLDSWNYIVSLTRVKVHRLTLEKFDTPEGLGPLLDVLDSLFKHEKVA
jgi:hypothetical protein